MTGFAVFAIAGSVLWTVLLITVPAPWSFAAMPVVLAIYVMYFSGRWWPGSTGPLRRKNFRSLRLSRSVWIWSLVAAVLAVVIIQSSLVVTFRLLPFPADEWTLAFDFDAVPLWMAWAFVFVAAASAGITEEVGFRGYMQVPLETRYGPATAIAIVSVVFLASHLHQAWAPLVLLQVFGVSVLWGVLARVSGSLVPGIISHTVTDIFNFSYWWTDIAGRFDMPTVTQTGWDSHFLAWVLVFVASLVGFSWSCRMAARSGASERDASIRSE